MPDKYYMCNEFGKEHGCFQEISLLDIASYTRSSKHDICKYLELEHFDYALPQWWVDDVAKITGIHAPAYFVWDYSEGNYDQPLAISRVGETILRIYNFIKEQEGK